MSACKELQTSNRELTQALEQQTATSDVLRIIASSPTDIQPVSTAIAERAVRLCGARFGRVYRYDGELIHMVAGYGLGAMGLAEIQRVFPRPANDETIVGRVILTRRPAVVRNIEHERDTPAFSRRMIEALGTRSQVTIPMLRAQEPIGAMTLGWAEPEAFGSWPTAWSSGNEDLEGSRGIQIAAQVMEPRMSSASRPLSRREVRSPSCSRRESLERESPPSGQRGSDTRRGGPVGAESHTTVNPSDGHPLVCRSP
jgi:GAF domain